MKGTGEIFLPGGRLAPGVIAAGQPGSRDPILEVIGLKTYFFTDEGVIKAVDGVSFSIPRGQTLALVGESGCGKSVTSYSLLRLVEEPGRIVDGKILLHSQRSGKIDIAQLRDESPGLYHVRGGLVSMIFQEPMTALSPVHTIGDQVMEAIFLHHEVTPDEARRRTVEMLGKVGMSAPQRRLAQYPHELSGGMRQRVVIAMALVGNPELLIADEPTTALDVTIQAQILGLIKSLQREIRCSVLLITHDLGVVAQAADMVAVMYLGRIVEHGPVRAIFKDPRHPYTQGLLRSIPSLNVGQRLTSLPGAVPSPSEISAGCPFHPRCPHAQRGRCDVGDPPAVRVFDHDREVACLRADEISAEQARSRSRFGELVPTVLAP